MSAVPGRWTGRPRTVRSALGALLALVLLAGCAQIPGTGSVQLGDVTVPTTGEIYVQAYGPSPGASPEEIVNGFVRAQAAGVIDDYAVAKEYLTPAAANLWDPTAHTTIYSGEPDLEIDDSDDTDESQVTDTGKGAAGKDEADETSTGQTVGPATVVATGTLSVAASLSEDGVLAEADPNATQDVSLRLRRTGGQWRIDKVNDGSLVSLPNFTSTYRSVNLEFFSLDQKYLVPDVRWYPQRNVVTYAVAGLLAGPSGWLRDAVSTAVPDGTTLSISAVTVSSEGEATVDLSSEILGATTAERALVRAQVEQTLAGVPEVRSVSFQADGAALSMPDPAAPVVDPIPGTSPTVLAGGTIGELTGKAIDRDPRVGPVTGLDVTALAVEPTPKKGVPAMVVVRDGSRKLWRLGSPATGVDPTLMASGKHLAAPSVDRYGWVWSARGGDQLFAVSASGERIDLRVPWLEGRHVDAVRTSHDGARIVVASSGDGHSAVQIEVAAVVRDGRGAPTSIGSGVPIGAPVVTVSQVVWVDEVTVAVLGTVAASSGETVVIVPLAGWSQPQPTVDHAVEIAAGRGSRSIFVLDKHGELATRGVTGVNWQTVADKVEHVAFPG